MKQSKLFSATLRDIPTDAEIKSHQFMLRSGFIRQLAAGIYTYLPMGWRVLRKIEQIVREEMDRAEAQEILMPAMQPAELWKESGRYEVYGPELIRLKDRHAREFALGPTHEEVVTNLAKNEISSYRRLPVTLYQIQMKFRDERRPRFGLLRGREFLMKDAYSFDSTWEGLDKSYKIMYETYIRIFERCGLNYRAVEADAGSIGGEGETHEFMILTDTGEDIIAACTHCDYAANLEKAQSGKANTPKVEMNSVELVKVSTPNIRTIDQLMQRFEVEPTTIIKTLIYEVDEKPVAVLVRGDHEVNEMKLKNYLHADNINLADVETTESVTGAPVGFAGPIGLKIPYVVDAEVVQMQTGIVGANEADYHYKNVVPNRDFFIKDIGDFHNVTEGDACPRCNEGILKFFKGIEAGHTFKLGTKYSDKLDASFLDANGRKQSMVMGCYGIGISRILAAYVEQNHDEKGMIWSPEISPFQVHLIPVSNKDELYMKIAEELYAELIKNGIEVLLDDRSERAGVKFHDSDLIGIPIRLVIGKHAVNGMVEYVERKNNEKQLLTKDDAFSRIIHGFN